MPDRSRPVRPTQPRILASPEYPNLVFVSHQASSSTDAHNTVIGHGRRLQLDKKHRDKRLLAQRDATYARGLVGWQSLTSTSDKASSGRRWESGEPQAHGSYQSPITYQHPWRSIEYEDQLYRGRQMSPSTILRRGQSDPFNTLAVEVTPEVNEIVSFFRDTMILAFYETRWETSKAAIVSMHWQSIVQALHDRGSALGWLGRNGQILSIVSKNKRVQLAALKYTTESTAILRVRLEQATELSETDQWHISMLWGTEILFRNLDAALYHGRMIKRMVEKQAEKSTLNLIAFRYILYYDTHLCTMLMVRSVFDYFKWVPDKYKVLEPVATSFMKLPTEGEDDAANNLDPSIQSEILLPLFKQRRRHMREYAFWLERAFEELNPYLQGWLAVCHHICHGQLITHALNCMDEAANPFGRERGRLLAEAYLSLAALYVTRTAAGGQLILCGVDVFEARRAILDKMYIILRSAGEIDDQDRRSYRNARLWALYVAARGARTLKNKPPHYEWFSSEFNSLREEKGLLSWPQTQQVLMGFLYSGSIDPIDDETLWNLSNKMVSIAGCSTRSVKVGYRGRNA
ncbi:hypothetical protein H2200_009830 [Cladophialophora chaetospira]|uniref:Uncharacterized protein n=1 Tax=Cladophialophora chaetospira TaxID=386627 RepID=A0AA38X362_9EURO|nr:hypothetical protein H2200_009830 [Cladophialophora chaetospira]